MSTQMAEVTQLFVSQDVADETVRRTVRGLIAARGLKVQTLAEAIGMQQSTLYRRLSGDGSQQAFSAGEVAAIASYFRVSVAQIFDGLGGAFVPPTTPGAGGWAPRRSATGTDPVTEDYGFLQVVGPIGEPETPTSTSATATAAPVFDLAHHRQNRERGHSTEVS